MRFFLVYLLLFSFCQGWGGPYRSEEITYAGVTIKCEEGCGTCEDPNLNDIWSILEKVIEKTFRWGDAFSETGELAWVDSPIRCNDSGHCRRWNWQATNGVWTFYQDSFCYQEISMDTYPKFLEVANMLREDIYFYCCTVPEKIREFRASLIPKLEEGRRQGHNAYKIFPGGEVVFKTMTRSRLDCSNWGEIDYRLRELNRRDFKEEERSSNETYKQKKEAIEKAIADIDELFQFIFASCLSRHQPEGIAFSSAIKALLAGNLTEGIEHIRALIKIGEAELFHPDLMAKMHLLKGELELESSLYADAILSLTEAIAKNQSFKEAYLARATAYFQLGQYDDSIEDYLVYADKAEEETSFPITSFSLAFAKALPSGIYESGKGFVVLLSDLIKHPVHTAKQVWESLCLLSQLAISEEWEELSQALAPEIHQLIVEWDDLSFEKRGELAGYAFGKYGSDLLIPGVLAKTVAKGMKSGREISAVYKNLRAADQTLLLESIAECKNVESLAGAMEGIEKTAFLGDELGFTTKEIVELKQAGKLEATLNEKINYLSLPQQESIKLFREAEKFLRNYKGFRPEHEIKYLIYRGGIPTFPRPKGIPENYRVKLSNNGAGIKYVHPNSEQTYVRVMPGKPHSPYLHQQRPYVVHMKNGKTLDKSGNVVLKEAPEAHIPLEEFIFIGE